MNAILRIGVALLIFLLPVLSAEAAGVRKKCAPQVSERLDLLKVEGTTKGVAQALADSIVNDLLTIVNPGFCLPE